MTGWTRCRRNRASPRRWIALLHAALERWYRRCAPRLGGRGSLSLERLEDIEAAGSLIPLATVLVSIPTHGSLTLNSDGSFTFTPSGFTGSDSFTYKTYDGVNYSSPVTVTLISGPVAAAQEYGVTHDQTLSVDATDGLLTAAVDADGDPLTAALATGASHGTVSVNSDGSFTYTPTTHYVGTDSFTFTVSDGTNTSSPATASLNVINSVPQAYPQTWDTPENMALTVNGASGVLASSLDDDGDALTTQLVSGTSNGTLQLGSDGSFTYAPNTGFFGTDSFSYAVTDGIATSDPATVTITVDQVVSENMPNSVYSAVATADFNNDGNTDVAVADQGLNTVSVFLDNSSGAIATTPISTTTVGATPVALVGGDFNGDGNQDLAVANSGSNTVSILLGNGSGGFTTGTPLTGFANPVALAAVDLNGDGNTDLAVVNKGSNAVSVLLGNGNGTFTAATPLTTGSSPTSIAAADFNNDGKLDLVATNSASNSVSVFLGNGNGTFASPLTDSVGAAPASVTTGDLNGDTFQDLAVANSGSNNVSVLLGNGDGSFQPAVNYAVGNNPVSIAAGNFDGNGYQDLSVANKGSNTLSSLYNWGNGQFFVGQTVTADSDPVSIAMGDFNHDGLTDQAAALSDPKVMIKLGALNADAKLTGIAAAYSPDGKVLAEAVGTGDDKHWAIKLWNPTTGNSLGVLTVNAPIKAIAYSHDTTQPARWLAIAVGGVGKPNEVEVEELRDTANPTLFQELDLPKGQIPRSVAFSSDDTYLTAGTQEASVVYWKLNKGEYQDPKNFSIGGKDNPVTEVFFFGPILAALSSDRLDFYHVSDGSHDDYTAEDGKMFAYDDVSSGLFPEKVILAIGYTSGTISVFEFNGGKIVYRASSESTKGLLSVDLIGSRLLKATSSSIQKFHVDNFPFWGVWSDEKASPPSSVVGMVVSPDGGTVAVTLQDGSVELYNRKDLTQPQVHTLR